MSLRSHDASKIVAIQGPVFVGPNPPVSPVSGTAWFDTEAAGSGLSVVTKTGDYTITVEDDVILANGTLTLTLPTAVGITGKCFEVKNIGTGAVTVDADGSETIDGSLSITMFIPELSHTFRSDNVNWRIV